MFLGGCSSGLGIQSISKKGTAVRGVCGGHLHLLGSQEVETGQDVNRASLYNSRLALLDWLHLSKGTQHPPKALLGD